MSEHDEAGGEAKPGGEQGQRGESRAGNEHPQSYRKNEEDATMLKEEERAGEDMGAKAGE